MTADATPLRAFLVDDEPLALERLQRLLSAFPEIQITGSATNPAAAVATLNTPGSQIDVLFLDIQMPEMNGFELLSKLNSQPFVIFTTAFDQHALRAFEINAIDYLLKPIEPAQLERALTKLGRIRPIVKPEWQQNPALPQLLKELTASLREGSPSYPHRVASRVGERISFLSLRKSPTSLRRISSPSPSQTAAATAWTRLSPISNTVSTPPGSCAFTVQRWSMSSGSTR